MKEDHSIYSFEETALSAAGAAQRELHDKALQLTREQFGRKVFVRGVVEVSNFCRQNCNYCGMRRDNRELERFRLSMEVVRSIIFEHLPPAITDINIQAGEDVVAVREFVLPLIQEIRAKTDLGISVCLGNLSERDYDSLREAGASYYILKLETGVAEHYAEVRAPATFEKRLAAIRYLASSGWSVSSGFIAGLPGQTTRHILDTLQVLSDLPLTGSSVSPFISGGETPYAGLPPGDLDVSLNSLAMMRLSNPQRIIPAVSAMNIVGKDGYVRALRAGANLTTINLTPSDWRQNYVLYQRDRFIMDERKVLRSIEAAGAEPSTESLAQWLRNRAPKASLNGHACRNGQAVR